MTLQLSDKQCDNRVYCCVVNRLIKNESYTTEPNPKIISSAPNTVFFQLLPLIQMSTLCDAHTTRMPTKIPHEGKTERSSTKIDA